MHLCHLVPQQVQQRMLQDIIIDDQSHCPTQSKLVLTMICYVPHISFCYIKQQYQYKDNQFAQVFFAKSVLNPAYAVTAHTILVLLMSAPAHRLVFCTRTMKKVFKKNKKSEILGFLGFLGFFFKFSIYCSILRGSVSGCRLFSAYLL